MHARIGSQVNYACPLFTTLLLLILTTVIKSLPITLQKVCLLNFRDRGMLSLNCSLTPHKLSPSSLNRCNFHLFLPFLVFPSQFWNLYENLSYLHFASEMSSHWTPMAEIKVFDLRCQQGFPSKLPFNLEWNGRCEWCLCLGFGNLTVWNKTDLTSYFLPRYLLQLSWRITLSSVLSFVFMVFSPAHF